MSLGPPKPIPPKRSLTSRPYYSNLVKALEAAERSGQSSITVYVVTEEDEYETFFGDGCYRAISRVRLLRVLHHIPEQVNPR